MDTLYCHSAPVKGKPGVTVAGIVDNGTLRIGIARCSYKDAFVRKLGNTMAQGRALAKKAPVVTIQDKEHLTEEFLLIAKGIILQHGGIPQQRKKQNENLQPENTGTVQ